MKHEKNEQLDRLFRAVRALKPETETVEANFETRLLATMAERSKTRETWSFWAWRLVPLFSMIVLIVGIGSVAIDPSRSGDLFAAFSTGGYDDYLTTSLLAGG